MNSLVDREKDSIFQTYNRLPISISEAKGCRVKDDNGNIYLDFLGGIAVNNLGHCNPVINEAIHKQVDKYLHVSNFFYQEPQIKLAEKLEELSNMKRVFFCNSGSEATEGSLKLARRWGHDNSKNELIAFTGGFHGRTYGALSIMDKPLYKEGMGPFLPNVKILPFNDISALENGLNHNVAAISIEFLQGEGGLTFATKEFVAAINSLREKYNFLVIADEIQSGLGRTGKFFAFQHYDFQPDIITIAKGLGGGMPLGAILGNEKVADVWSKGMHGTTFGGNAVSCAAGYAMLNEYEKIKDDIILNSEYLKSMLEQIVIDFPDKVQEYRGIGFMCGLKLNFEAARLVQKMLERKVIVNSTSVSVLRLVPPFIITKEDIDEFISKLRDALNDISLS